MQHAHVDSSSCWLKLLFCLLAADAPVEVRHQNQLMHQALSFLIESMCDGDNRMLCHEVLIYSLLCS